VPPLAGDNAASKRARSGHSTAVEQSCQMAEFLAAKLEKSCQTFRTTLKMCGLIFAYLVQKGQYFCKVISEFKKTFFY
jgi:hypothetical protein